jgi:hypothetical protein
VTGSNQPQPDVVEQYAALYPQYRRLYPALKDTFGNLANVQKPSQG